MSAKRGPRARRRIGVADTTFARWDMGRAVVDELKNRPGDFEILRTTVPGIKDLPVACKTLIEARGCDLVVACGYVGGAPIDRDCATVADHALQHAQLMTNTPILGVFVYETEAKDERELAGLCERRAREHAVNAWRMLFKPEELAAMAGTGQRQGHADAGPIQVVLREHRPRRE